jgi:hypothetical protein
MENQASESTSPQAGNEKNNVNADTVNVEQSAVGNINATNVTLRQAGAQSITTNQLTVRQGGMVKVKTENLEVTQGGVGLLQSSQAKLVSSRVGAVVAGGNVNLDLSSTRVLVAGGAVNLDQSASVILVGNNVKTQNSPIVFLFARNVEGNVSTTFGPQESIIFGAAAGLVAGVMLLLGSLFRRRRRK